MHVLHIGKHREERSALDSQFQSFFSNKIKVFLITSNRFCVIWRLSFKISSHE
ncbi:hypothetical protein Syun_005033 [Stephania yunnanensis]|uniref:Uncharacterized protein n=1 Tax=Stephania yunnanensis TaxID=152371 RepID=A0AAP0L4I2_9MAGN